MYIYIQATLDVPNFFEKKLREEISLLYEDKNNN